MNKMLLRRFILAMLVAISLAGVVLAQEAPAEAGESAEGLTMLLLLLGVGVVVLIGGAAALRDRNDAPDA